MPPHNAEDDERPFRASLDGVLARLIAFADGDGAPPKVTLADSLLAAPRLEALIEAFDLDAFEAHLLALAFAVEMMPEAAALCAACQGDEARRHLSFRLAAALFPGGDWRSFGPSAPLRHWLLIELDATRPLLDAPVWISEFALHWLCGRPSRPAPLTAILAPRSPRVPRLAPSHRALATRIARGLHRTREVDATPHAIHLVCDDPSDIEAMAAAVARIMRAPLDILSLDAILQAGDRAGLAHLLRRGHRLVPSLLLVSIDDRALSGEHAAALSDILRRVGTRVLFGHTAPPARLPLPGPRFVIAPPTREEQFARWRALLGASAKPLEAMLGRFDMRLGGIETAHREAAVARKAPGAGRAPPWRAFVSEACRRQLRGPLDAFATRLEGRGTVDDLVLPASQRAQFDAIVADVGNRSVVLGQWTKAGRSARGLGVTALFSGPSGTGKTTAAEILAGLLDLDLYRVDLAAIVSKYIGETEKQLSGVFDAAERGPNLLLFDEGDALFGKRTDVRDSHDRYANQGVSFLLQRLESYSGVAVVASNLADALDTAFLRRFRYIIEFPLPNAEQRQAIWRRMLEGQASHALDMARLARLALSGGAIRNVALRAAFLAAAADGVITMPLLAIAAKEEYRKLHRVMTAEERLDDEPRD